MKAIVFKSVGQVDCVERDKPELSSPHDAIVKVLHSSICGTDLHILRGHVPTCNTGRILGHEGVGIVETLGSAVTNFEVGTVVLISCITSCGFCPRCRQGMQSHCATGGWVLGNTIDGTQAEFVRVPHAASSLIALPNQIDLRSAVTLSDALPTAYECGILPSDIKPGCSVAIIGPGPVGLATLLLAKLFSPSIITVIGRGSFRLEVAKRLGASHTFSTAENVDDCVQDALSVANGEGYDLVVECVGNAITFEIGQRLLGLGSTLCNVGVHGGKADLQLDHLWPKNINVTSRLVDSNTIPELIKLIGQDKLDVQSLVSHNFKQKDFARAYDVFQAGSSQDVIKVVIDFGQ